MRLRTRAARVVRRGLHRFGLDLVPYADQTLLYGRRLRLLRERPVTVVLDVGANTGQWARALRGAGYAGRLVSFEPLSSAYAELERSAAGDAGWECWRLALGDHDGETDLNVAGNSLSSSLLPMAERHLAAAPESRYLGTERVRMARLDSLAAELLGPGDRVFLKLDVQGAETAVLAGAGETLPRAEGVECELSLAPLYDGQALFADVVDRLDREGFDLVALEPAFADPRTGDLLQAEGLFARRRD